MGGQIFFVVICLLLGNRTSEFCWYFLIGVYVRRMQLLENSKSRFLALCVILGAFILPITIEHNFYDESFRELMGNKMFVVWGLRILVGALFSLGFMSVVRTVSKKYSLVSKVGTMTLGIYIVHSVYVIFIGKQLLCVSIKTGSSPIDWMLMALTTFVAMVLSVLTIMLMRNNRYIKMIFLGEF